jgi:hypothetical protein
LSASKVPEIADYSAQREARRPKLKQAQRRGVVSNKANADRFAANVLPVIEQIKASGATSLRAIAKALNARGVATARGGVWTPVR